uniref:Uncharacterized protein n=1 Tax=Panagrolaimus sp. JU765 TaxID=591449 RepID=A0AC34RR39_9BILA
MDTGSACTLNLFLAETQISFLIDKNDRQTAVSIVENNSENFLLHTTQRNDINIVLGETELLIDQVHSLAFNSKIDVEHDEIYHLAAKFNITLADASGEVHIDFEKVGLESNHTPPPSSDPPAPPPPSEPAPPPPSDPVPPLKYNVTYFSENYNFFT